MRFSEVLLESAAEELATRLPGLNKHDYNALDTLVKRVANKHKITDRVLRDLFVKKYHLTPDSWIHDKLDESPEELDIHAEVNKFVQWAVRRLHLTSVPKVELSLDTHEAQHNHHTGGHELGASKIWVYAKNRNLVDILRTVFHELVHVRQEELGMVEPGDSYPGSPIEVMADMLAGKYIKIYGEKNHHIFQ